MDLNRWSRSYYSVLGVDPNSSISEIRSAYRKLAMQWHPDKWTRTPALAEQAKQRFQEIVEAYAVLSDQSKRTLYDTGLYDPDEEEEEEEEEGFSEFVEEMLSLMAQVKREEKSYTLGDLQHMLMEMAYGFNFDGPRWTALETSGSSKRARSDADLARTSSRFHVATNAHVYTSGLDVYSNGQY